MAKTSSKLQDELKKRSGFESLSQEAWLNLVRTASLLTGRFERFFSQFGLTATQYNILRILRGEGAPLPILEIASRLITPTPGITGLVDRLEQAGYVLRERCPKDRRVIRVALQDSALKLLAKIDQPLTEMHHGVMQPLQPEELQQLIALLERLRAHLPPAAS